MPTELRNEPRQDACDARQIASALLAFVDTHLPGLADLVEYAELGTPLSVEHFAAHPDGAGYGVPAVPARFALDWLGVTTPVRGLLLTGSDACCHGIGGAMMGGVGTAAHMMGAAGFPVIMRAAGGRRIGTVTAPNGSHWRAFVERR